MQTKLIPYIIIGVLVVAGIAGASLYFATKQPAEPLPSPVIEELAPPSEEITQTETTKWKGYTLEEISQDFKSHDFYDRRLIGIQDNDQRDVIVLSMKEALGESKEDITWFPGEVSFPSYSTKIFFVKHLSETGHSIGLIKFDVKTLTFRELTEIGKIYENYYNYASLVSPDGFKIASYGNNDLYLLDLLQDKAILLAKAQIGETFYLAAETPEFQWVNDHTIQYPVHSAQDIYAPPIETRQISIETKKVKIVKDETAKIKVNLYYYNQIKDKEIAGYISCSPDAVLPVEREIPVTKTPIQDTIKLLIVGELTEKEETAGFSTEFPHQEFKLLDTDLKDGILTLEFSEVFGFTTGGACRVGLLATQIRKTAKQFSEVKEVFFEPESLFQP